MIAWIWIDYFRRIDVFEREGLVKLILVFVLGAASTHLVFLINDLWLDGFSAELNGNLFNDFLYATLKVGLVEEFSKLIPFLIVFVLFYKSFNEPLDYLIVMSISALGFSAYENVIYFKRFGADIVTSRAILSTVGHIFDTALIAFGIVRYIRNKNTSTLLGIPAFFLLAALSHGIYDFWLMQTAIPGGILFTIGYFLITISWFSTILNNAINSSPFFSYKHPIEPNKLSYRLLIYYGVVFFSAFVLNSVEKGIEKAAYDLLHSLYFAGIIVAICCIRLSRFTLLKGHWFPLKIELPFRMNFSGIFSGVRPTMSIKGENHNDALISRFYHEEFMLYPLNRHNTYLGSARKAYMKDKSLGKHGEIFFPVRVYGSSASTQPEDMILTSKTEEATLYKDNYPVVGVYLVKRQSETDSKKKFRSEFKEWCVVMATNERPT